jgi:undecaprenyl-diphosphatase
LFVLVALLIGLLLANLTVKPLVARPRPFQIDTALTLLIPPPGEFSFPSGHSVSSAAAATVLALGNKKFGWVAVPLAALIAFSRLYLTVHFPTDVIAGLLLGCAIGLFTWFVLRPLTVKKR